MWLAKIKKYLEVEIVSSSCVLVICVHSTQRSHFNKNTRRLGTELFKNALKLIFICNNFLGILIKIWITLFRTIFLNDLVYLMVFSHFMLSPKAEISKGQSFFSKRETLIRLLDFVLWPLASIYKGPLRNQKRKKNYDFFLDRRNKKTLPSKPCTYIYMTYMWS